MNATANTAAPNRRYDALLVALVVLLAGATYWDVWRGLFGLWAKLDYAYSHGFPVLAIAAYLTVDVLRRNHFTPRPSILGLFAVALSSIGVALAQAINVEVVQRLGVVFLIWSGFLAVLGWRAAFALAFPVAFLYFAIPFWDYLSYPLQRLTAFVDSIALGFTDIRFRLQQTSIHLEDVGIIRVANGCSGQRYLVIALTISSFFCYLNLRRARNWVLLIGAAALLGLVTNWIRVLVLILIGYESVMQSDMLHEHEMFGWILFVAALVPLFLLGGKLARREESELTADTPNGEAGKNGSTETRSSSTMHAMLLAGIAALLVVAPPAYLHGIAAPSDGEPVQLEFPQRFADWQRSFEAKTTGWQPDWQGADAVNVATYVSDAGNARQTPVTIGAWYYQAQEPGSELIQYANRLYDPQLWTATSHRTLTDAEGYEAVVLAHRNARKKVAFAYTFSVGRHLTSSRVTAKGLQLWAVLKGDPESFLLTVAAPCEGECTTELKAVTDVAEKIDLQSFVSVQ